MTTQRFKTTIIQSGSKTGIQLPFQPNEVWGSKPRHHVRGTVNGVMVRGPITQDGDQSMLALGPSWLRDNGLAAGAAVEVELFPEGPQVDQLAPDLAAALDAEPQARAFFESLATFYRKGYLRWVDGARKPEVRAERIAELVVLLKAQKKQK
jgi:hypothetical protein